MNLDLSEIKLCGGYMRPPPGYNIAKPSDLVPGSLAYYRFEGLDAIVPITTIEMRIYGEQANLRFVVHALDTGKATPCYGKAVIVNTRYSRHFLIVENPVGKQRRKLN